MTRTIDVDKYTNGYEWIFRVRETNVIIGYITRENDQYYATLSDERVTRFPSYRSANAYLMFWADELEALEDQLPDQ